MKPTNPSWPWPLVAALAITAAAMLAARATEAQTPRCRGTKQWYAGKCRYPDDIAKMKAEDAGRRGGEQRRKAEAEAAARRQAEQARLRDIDDCGQARQAGTVQAWRAYLAKWPDGFCRKEAERRAAELETSSAEQPAPMPAVEPPTPKPAPKPEPTGAYEQTPSRVPASATPSASPTSPPPPTQPSASVPLGAPARDRTEPRSNSALVVAGVVALGAGVLTGAVGTIFGVKAIGAKADFDASPNADSADEFESSTLLADIFIPVAAVAGVGGAVLLALGLADGDAAAEQAVLLPRLAPCVGPSGSGMAATWSF
ncbi:MAG: hypothetical protein HY744_31440 [Deltaproteobacteria bacterium]|nr:hypothetical protein [Deltaproteobacteria bacterium]